VDLLVKAGADIHLATTKSGGVPLEVAAASGHSETAKCLLDAGATVNYRRKDGRTPLCGASFNGHAEVVRLLLERGAGVNICDKVRRENM
jgi:ankyrin repeat protein